MILVVDNYDSFVFNLARYFQELGARTLVLRNDAVDAATVERLAPQAIVLSPGPCGPREAGASLDLVRAFTGRLPILGVCLGHQCVGAAFGAPVVRAREPMHGRASAIRHDGADLFAGLPPGFRAGRYHSLIVELDDETAGPLVATPPSAAREVMALRHRTAPTFGVQFHPESVLTEHGHALLGNFLRIAEAEAPR